MLGARQKEAVAELAQWWDGIRLGGVGSHAVLLVGPEGWGRSTVLSQLVDVLSHADAPSCPSLRINGRSLQGEGDEQALAVRDGLLGAEMRRHAAALLFRSRLYSAPLLGIGGLRSAIAGTISLLLAAMAAAANGTLAGDTSADADSAAARAARS